MTNHYFMTPFKSTTSACLHAYLCGGLCVGIQYQHFALSLGNFVKRQNVPVWREVQRSTDRGAHRRGDGPALHNTASPCEMELGRLLVREGLRAAQT